jgi:hypothetical protein
MVLNCRFEHYGFALAMPAGVLLSVLLVELIPTWVGRRGGSDLVCRGLLLGAWLGTLLWFVGVTRQFSHQEYVVGSGADTILADSRGAAMTALLQVLPQLPGTKPATLVALPHGVMLNYLARWPNPTPYMNFTPMDFDVFSEGRILDSLQSHAPDCIAVVSTDMSQFGTGAMGRDYGKQIGDWVSQNYRPAAIASCPPDRTGRVFRIQLWRREDRTRSEGAQ